jgi:hypothetical protein
MSGVAKKAFEEALDEYGNACTHRYEERVEPFRSKEYEREEREAREAVMALYVAALQPNPVPTPRPLTQHHIDWVGGGVGVCRDPFCGCRDTTLPVR